MEELLATVQAEASKHPDIVFKTKRNETDLLVSLHSGEFWCAFLLLPGRDKPVDIDQMYIQPAINALERAKN